MQYCSFYRTVIVFCLGLFFLDPPFSIGQDVTGTPAEANISESSTDESAPLEPLAIKLSVEEVRLDVVVLDNRGNPVTDLTVQDFEVFQNGARRNVISSVYVDYQTNAAAKPSIAKKNNRNSAPLPNVDLKREDTRRTIIFVADDLSMSFENGYHARMALRNFVEKQMQTGDMVAFFSTGHGSSALQMFLSDKREALARIDSMRIGMSLQPYIDGSHLYRVYENQLSTLSYSLRALKDMPGRKIIVMLTAEPSFRTPSKQNASLMQLASETAPLQAVDFSTLYESRINRLSDDALRGGVVVNFLNIGGLKAFSTAKDESGGRIERDAIQLLEEYLRRNDSPSYRTTDRSIQDAVQKYKENGILPDEIQRTLERMYPQEFENERNASVFNVVNPLPAKTGGVVIENQNFFLEGIGRETESLIKGYYLISYEPPSDTFRSDGKEIFNQIRVNVRRRGVQVYTRDGFYNRLERELPAVAAPTVHPLQDAVFSPFMYTGLDVNLSAGYVRDAEAGHLVRSWIHLDPKDVKIVETEDGGARIDLEIVILTSDTNGFVQDVKFVEHTLTVEPENKVENLAWIQHHGIRFAMMLPVKKPGSYYVRVAVLDKESGKTGSAYQFLEIPDSERKGLALSNIFMITNEADMKWLMSGSAAEIDKELFFPVFQAVEVLSPALRTFAVGDNIQVLTMLYGADEKVLAGAEIEMRFVIYRDGKELLSTERPVGTGKAGSIVGIPLSLRMTMGTDLPPGDYVLELAVTDKANSGRREGNASQAISFTVTK